MPLLTLPSQIRGAFSTERNGVQETYAVAGNVVYSLRYTDGGWTYDEIGLLETEDGEVRFMCYEGWILLLDGREFYTLTPQQANVLQGYIPLYAKDLRTGSNVKITVYEPLNLLSYKIRLRYQLESRSDPIYFSDLHPELVEAVYLNGVKSDLWMVAEANRYLTVKDTSFSQGEVEVVVRLPESMIDRAAVTVSSEAVSIGQPHREQLLLYGKSIGTGCLWISRTMDEAQRAATAYADANSCPLYITSEDTVTLGDGIQPITGICHHYDRTLFFTANGVWMSNGEQDENGKLRILRINDTMGCSASGGLGVVGNSPISIFGRSILRWSSNTDEQNECNGQVISLPVEAMFEENFGVRRRIFADIARREIWLYVPGASERIYLWLENQGGFCSFDGFSPQGLFMLGERVGFYVNEQLYVLDRNATYDTDASGQEKGIDSQYQSYFFDLGDARAIKHLHDVMLLAQGDEQSVDLILQHVDGREFSVPLNVSQDLLSPCHRRVSMGRFRFVRVGIRAKEKGTLRVRSLSLTGRA